MIVNPRDIVQQVSQGGSQVDMAKSQLILAETNLKRYEELFEEDAIAASVLDQYRTAYDVAVASYRSALAQAVQNRNALSYTKLCADVDGVVSNIQAEVGQVISQGQTVLTNIYI